MKYVLILLAEILTFVWLMPARANDTVYYYYTNTLHSAVVEANAQGAVVETTYYAPYGQVLDRSMRDGPGYTGHEEDPETGLNYMQQRYYDPQSGRFLSTDPMQTADDGGNFNRYWYANNNPYRYTDPDGRKIDYVLNNGATNEDKTKTMKYLSRSPTAEGEISRLTSSKLTYTISFDREANDHYDDTTRTVVVNPREGLIVKSSGKIQSPAIGAGHEISHAAQHDRVGSEAFKISREAPFYEKANSDGSVSITVGASPEEKRATSVESEIAHELGDNVRKNYSDTSGTVRTCGATSTKQC